MDDAPKKRKFRVVGSYVTYVKVDVEAENEEELEKLLMSQTFFDELDWLHDGSDEVEVENYEEVK
jgi:hypothetical protein